MLAGAVSADGRQLALSGAYSKGGDAAGIVSFLRMSDGEVFTSDAEDEIYVKMFYADDGRLFARKQRFRARFISFSDSVLRGGFGPGNLEPGKWPGAACGRRGW